MSTEEEEARNKKRGDQGVEKRKALQRRGEGFDRGIRYYHSTVKGLYSRRSWFDKPAAQSIHARRSVAENTMLKKGLLPGRNRIWRTT